MIVPQLMQKSGEKWRLREAAIWLFGGLAIDYGGSPNLGGYYISSLCLWIMSNRIYPRFHIKNRLVSKYQGGRVVP